MNPPPSDPVYGLAVGHLPEGNAAIFTARQEGVDISLNLGTTWTTVWTGSVATAIALSPNFGVDGLVVVGVEGGVIRSNDWGATWQFHPLPALRSLVSSLSISIGESSSYLVLAGTIEDGIYRSVDRGLTWAPSNVGAYIPRITSIFAGLSPLCMVGTDGGMFLSINDGLTWSDEGADQIDTEVTSVIGDNNLLVFGTESEGIFWCCRGDERWSVLRGLPSSEETIALAIIGVDAGPSEVIVITRTQIQSYHCGPENCGSSVHPTSAVTMLSSIACATIFTSDDTLHAVVADIDGDIRITSITKSWENRITKRSPFANLLWDAHDD